MSTDSRPTAVAITSTRYASERFPGKVIAPLLGKPLVLHAYQRASEASCVSNVIIATDDERVVDAVALEARDSKGTS